MAKRKTPFTRAMVARRWQQKRRRRPTMLRMKVRDEIKQVDIVSANYAFFTTPVLTLINGMALGSDNFNRIGRKVFMKSIQVRGSIRPSLTTTLAEYMRIALVYDRQPNGAAPAYADIFQMTTQAGATSSTSESLPNEANKNRFSIIKDFQYDYPGNVGPNQNTSPSQVINWFIPLKDSVTHYLGTTAAVASITTGSLYFVMVSRALAVGVAEWQFTGAFRLRYSES